MCGADGKSEHIGRLDGAQATSSAEAPCAYVRCALPIFSPTVTTMRFQPIIVPKPKAMATATLTQAGMNLVTLSMLE